MPSLTTTNVFVLHGEKDEVCAFAEARDTVAELKKLGAPATLVNVPIGTVLAFRFEPGTDGLVVTLADAMLDELLAHDPDVRRALGRGWVGDDTAGIDAVMTLLAQEYAGRSPARALVLRGLGATLLGRAARVAERIDPHGAHPSNSLKK